LVFNENTKKRGEKDNFEKTKLKPPRVPGNLEIHPK
jgi:hypothetical protein